MRAHGGPAARAVDLPSLDERARPRLANRLLVAREVVFDRHRGRVRDLVLPALAVLGHPRGRARERIRQPADESRARHHDRCPRFDQRLVPGLEEFERDGRAAQGLVPLAEHPLVPGERAPVRSGDERQELVVSSDRIRAELGYEERVPLAEGLRRTIEWERANPRENAERDYEAEDAALAQLKQAGKENLIDVRDNRALLQERDRLQGKRVGLVLSGGNIDRALYLRILGAS